MIIPIPLFSGDISIIIPSLLFIGILSGIMNKNTLNESILTTLIAFIIGSIISLILSIITVYYDEGALYAIAIISYALFNIIYFTFIGCIGSSLGYYIKEEIKGETKWI